MEKLDSSATKRPTCDGAILYRALTIHLPSVGTWRKVDKCIYIHVLHMYICSMYYFVSPTRRTPIRESSARLLSIYTDLGVCGWSAESDGVAEDTNLHI